MFVYFVYCSFLKLVRRRQTHLFSSEPSSRTWHFLVPPQGSHFRLQTKFQILSIVGLLLTQAAKSLPFSEHLWQSLQKANKIKSRLPLCDPHPTLQIKTSQDNKGRGAALLFLDVPRPGWLTLPRPRLTPHYRSS